MIQIGGRKKFLVLLTSIFLVTGVVFGGYLLYKNKFRADITIPPPAYGINMVNDPGFEDTESWLPLPTPLPDSMAKWEIATDNFHTGNQSLKYSNTDTDPLALYEYIELSLSHGDIYNTSVWIKTENVVCPNNVNYGASLDIEPIESTRIQKGPIGTMDWTQYTVSSLPIGFDLTYMRLSLFLFTGCTGTVWYDDIEATLTSGTTFLPHLHYPNYRGIFLANQPRNLEFDAQYQGTDHDTTDFLLSVELKNNSGNLIWQDSQRAPPAQALKHYLFTRNFDSEAPGDYTLTAKLTDSGGALLQTQDFTLIIPNPIDPLPSVYIDQYNRTVKDGKLLFPIGVYSSITNLDTNMTGDLNMIKEINFNTYLPYMIQYSTGTKIKGYLSKINTEGINLVFSVKDAYNGNPKYEIDEWVDMDGNIVKGKKEMFEAIVNTFKDPTVYPSILGWYINDELDGPEFTPQLQERYNFIKQNDPNHPAWQVLYGGQDFPSHFSNTDIMGLDNYPVWGTRNGRTQPIQYEDVGKLTKKLNNLNCGSFPYWMVPELAMKDSFRQVKDSEMINYAYQSLVNGVRGLIYFNLTHAMSRPDFDKTELEKVGTHLNKIAPIALGLDAPATKSLTSSSDEISVITREVDENSDGIYESVYAMAVNPYDKSIPSTFTIGSGLEVKDISVGLPGENPTAALSLYNNTFTDNFASLETRVYKINLTSQAIPIIPTIPTVSATPSFTYKDKRIVQGTKDSSITQILINGSSDGVVLNGDNWSKEVSLNIGEKTTFNVIAKNSDGIESEPVNFDITRRKTGDANGDNGVNINDFSSLMSNWNKQGSGNVADFNEDNSVNIYDFSAMMSG